MVERDLESLENEMSEISVSWYDLGVKSGRKRAFLESSNFLLSKTPELIENVGELDKLTKAIQVITEISEELSKME